MGKIACGNIAIEGLYALGTGFFSSGAADVWDDYWMSLAGVHPDMKPVVTYQSCSWGRTFYLVDNGMSIYLHPMQTSFVISSSNSAESNKFRHDIRDVADCLDGLAALARERLGISIRYAIEWKVLREEYDPISYIPDDGETYRIANQ